MAIKRGNKPGDDTLTEAAKKWLESIPEDVRPKNLAEKPWWIAALARWGIALFEYLLMVPANRVGYTELSLAQLKILWTSR